MKDIVLFIWLCLNFLPIVVPALKMAAVRNQKVGRSLIVFGGQGEPFGDQVPRWTNRIYLPLLLHLGGRRHGNRRAADNSKNLSLPAAERKGSLSCCVMINWQ
jgi:hypothetical protein